MNAPYGTNHDGSPIAKNANHHCAFCGYWYDDRTAAKRAAHFASRRHGKGRWA